MAYLEITEGINRGVIFRLQGETVIGRAPTSALCLPDSRASREHARIKHEDDTFVITDLGSANGTYVNDNLLTGKESAALGEGDEIVVCSTRMQFHLDRDPVAAQDEDASGITDTAVDRKNAMTIKEDGTGTDYHLDARQNMAAVLDSERTKPDGLMEAVKRLQAMLKIAAAAAECRQADACLDRIMQCVLTIFPTAERAVILLPDAGGDMMPHLACSRYGDTDEELYAVSRTILSQVVEKHQSVMSCDAQKDYSNSRSIADLAIISMMCAPLMCKDEILGVIQVDSRTLANQFTEDDLAVLTGIAHQAALALKTLQLTDKVEQMGG